MHTVAAVSCSNIGARAGCRKALCWLLLELQVLCCQCCCRQALLLWLLWLLGHLAWQQLPQLCC